MKGTKLKLFLSCVFFVLLLTTTYFVFLAERSYSSASKAQQDAAEFTRDVCVAIKNCHEADDSIVQVICEEDEDTINVLVRLFEAKRKLVEVKKQILKWKQPHSLKEILDEIDEIEDGINELIEVCDIWIEVLEGSQYITDSKTALLISKIKAGREHIFKFAAGWGSRIHQTGNNLPTHHIQLKKEQYILIRQYARTILKDELAIVQDPGMYVWSAKIIDFVISEELGK